MTKIWRLRLAPIAQHRLIYVVLGGAVVGLLPVVLFGRAIVALYATSLLAVLAFIVGVNGGVTT